ncbi:MAG TPA: hypothetical protein VEV38_08930 [Candidatus Eremiobacteraceae bacterium]|nr:hypothetical protein [Candidatus Eremiobacteraceae bacterium]
MRQRTFLIALLIAIAFASIALAPFSIAIILRNRAGAGGRRIVSQTRKRLNAARDLIARGIRAVNA